MVAILGVAWFFLVLSGDVPEREQIAQSFSSIAHGAFLLMCVIGMGIHILTNQGIVFSPTTLLVIGVACLLSFAALAGVWVGRAILAVGDRSLGAWFLTVSTIAIGAALVQLLRREPAA